MKVERKNYINTYEPFKRLSDQIIAAIGLLAVLPIMIMVALAIFVDDPGPIIFKQMRAGRYHKPFKIYKFRTMRQNTPHLSTEEMKKLNLNPYTRLGIFLRKTSLDELPQLINVLQGDMSLVGPRPALMSQESVLKGREARKVDHLRPGITGLAQITGRDDLNDQEKVEKDFLYLQNVGPITDIILLIYTAKRIRDSKGVY